MTHMIIVHLMINKIYSLLVLTGVYRLLAKIIKITAATGKGSDICLEEGFLPLPVHFYSPVPDLSDLVKRNIWEKVSDLPGINFRRQEQPAFLAQMAERFAGECQWPLMPTNDSQQFYLKNPSFGYGCAASTHCMIRCYEPAAVIEIGSGMSSRVIAAALGVNRREGHPSQYLIVDPYPGAEISGGAIDGAELVKTRVELLDTSFFSLLKENDILFIDSSHSVKTGSDVNYLYLEVLPRLDPVVIVHVHDICFPYEYPRAYATSESFRQFWTEQYLLQGFLQFNDEFEVLLSLNYLMVDHAAFFREVFPYYAPDVHPSISGSFWMRRKIACERSH